MRFEGRDVVLHRMAMLLLYTNQCRYRPTNRTLARGLDISVRTAQRYLHALEEVGWPMPAPRQEDADV